MAFQRAYGFRATGPAGLVGAGDIATSALGRCRYAMATLVAPAGLGWTPPILPVSTPHGWRGNISARSLRPALVSGSNATYYVDPVYGNDGAAGTSAAPLKTIEIALEKSDAGTVLCAPGIYYRDTNPGQPSYAANSNPIRLQRWMRPGSQGPALITTAYTVAELAWVANGTYPTAYDSGLSITAFGKVVDVGIHNGAGGYMEYRQATSLANCGAQRGTWFLTGTTLTVHPMRPGAPDQLVLCLRGEVNFDHNVAKPLYIEGLTFMGGDQAAKLGTSAGDAIAVDCEFLHGATGNGIYVQSDNVTILENCRAEWNANDGFNYSTSSAGKFLELNCVGSNNGTSNVGVQNGSSAHVGYTGARYGGRYERNHGPNIADVGTVKCWNVGALGQYSRNLNGVAGTVDDDFLFNDTVQAWLYACSGRKLNATSSTVYVDTCAIQETQGTPITYEQVVQ